MVPIRPMKKNEHIVRYSQDCASQIFKGVVRENGLPYTQEHLAKMRLLTHDVISPSVFQGAVEAAAWWHDGPEDIFYIDVFDPFGSGFQLKLEKIYINNLLEKAGDSGKYACHITDLMTHREGISYEDYVNNIYSFPEDELLRPLRILTGVMKAVDRRLNINPDDRKNVDNLVHEYLALDGSDTKILEAFYKRTKTIDAFREKGDYSIDVGLFVETVKNAFKKKQLAFALDNLGLYLPLAERKLLIEVGDNNGLFDWHKVKQVLKDTYIDSLSVTTPYGIDIHVVKMMGANKKVPEVEGYIRILKEIRNDLLERKYEL